MDAIPELRLSSVGYVGRFGKVISEQAHCVTSISYLTLQDDQNFPSQFGQSALVLPISLDVPIKLRLPECDVRFGHRRVSASCVPMQKQPCTKITVRYFGKTISGVPGRSFRCKRNLNPSRWAADRTTRSGPEPHDRTSRMISDRLAVETWSVIGGWEGLSD